MSAESSSTHRIRSLILRQTWAKLNPGREKLMQRVGRPDYVSPGTRNDFDNFYSNWVASRDGLEHVPCPIRIILRVDGLGPRARPFRHC